MHMGNMGLLKIVFSFSIAAKTGAYHDDMNYDNFSKWVQNMLLPNMSTNSVVVLDYVSYHKVQDN